MLPFTDRAITFAVLTAVTYLSFKASDAMRGWIADGRAEHCYAIISMVAIVLMFAVRRRLTVRRAAQAWGVGILAGLAFAATLRWPPPMMMFLDVGCALVAVVACAIHRRMNGPSGG